MLPNIQKMAQIFFYHFLAKFKRINVNFFQSIHLYWIQLSTETVFTSKVTPWACYHPRARRPVVWRLGALFGKSARGRSFFPVIVPDNFGNIDTSDSDDSELPPLIDDIPRGSRDLTLHRRLRYMAKRHPTLQIFGCFLL